MRIEYSHEITLQGKRFGIARVGNSLIVRCITADNDGYIRYIQEDGYLAYYRVEGYRRISIEDSDIPVKILNLMTTYLSLILLGFYMDENKAIAGTTSLPERCLREIREETETPCLLDANEVREDANEHTMGQEICAEGQEYTSYLPPPRD